MSLTARHLEANGMPTVILGSARDIVEHCGVPRFVFSDFPLGNSAGLPFEPDMQRRIVELGLELLESARQPRTTHDTTGRVRTSPAGAGGCPLPRAALGTF